MAMANVSCQFGQLGFDIPLRLIPSAQCPNHKVVTKIMNRVASASVRKPENLKNLGGPGGGGDAGRNSPA